MFLALVSLPAIALAVFVPASDVASNYSLTTSTVIPFPTATLSGSDTDNFLVANWGLSKGRVQNSAQDLSFVDDPFPDSNPPSDKSATSSGPVLKVDYPGNGFGPMQSGTQFYSLFNNSSPFQSMLLSYEVSFDTNYDWVKGGKLPGIRGGPDPNGCSGGSQPNGTDCFSIRIMWRPNGAGEVYAYIPRSDSMCNSNHKFICNDDFGISIQRGSFSFRTASWNRISLLVLLNSPANVANGYVAVYYNDVLALSQAGLQLRAGDVINAGGLYFSTFFGGSDSSWSPPTDQHAYFRNLQLWGGTAPSNQKVSSAIPAQFASLQLFICVVATSLFVFCRL